MSESQYYIRVRGRVQGPFNVEQLHTMAKRGQFSRLHEVSSDGNAWARAADSPELFPVCNVSVTVSAPVAASAAVQEIPLAPSPGLAPPPEPAAAPAAPRVEWYYTRNGAQSGPHDVDLLKMLVSSGQLGAHDLAWSAGMPSWQPIHQIPGLNAMPPTAAPLAAAFVSHANPRGSEEPRTAGMAIAAVVLGILAAALATGSVALSLFVHPAVSIGAWLAAMFVSVLTLIFGHSARKQIRQAPTRLIGDGMAITGLVMAYVILALAAFVILILLALITFGALAARAAML